MQLSNVEFNYEPGTDYGTGVLFITNKHKYHYFDFEFSAFQEQDCSYSSHSSTQVQPDEDYYEYDVIDEITNLDTLVHKIEAVFGVTDVKERVDGFIKEEFDRRSNNRYLYTRKG